MVPLTISEVARQAGLRTSAIRYYEQVGILAPARRLAGQRRYEASVLNRLAVIRRAQDVGFTLDEIRQLFRGFQPSTPVSKRWKAMAERKLIELDAQMDRVRAMKDLLLKMQSCCACETLEQCGAGMLTSASRPAARSPRRDSPVRG
ncbi:MAG TPA: MerR family transcriptional regulator [Bryobacteraceae bacterium]|nr:MerR family transcriptional regulator [Bryobacteraceae bacterium]